MKGKADSKEPNQEAGNNNKNANEVTDIPGSVIKANFNIGGLFANRAFFMHFHIPLNTDGQGVPE